MSTEYIGDFCCGAADFVWEMDGAVQGSRGNWAACQECHELIQRGDSAGLARRCVDTFILLRRAPREDQHTVSVMVRSLYRGSWHHRAGDPYRYTA